MNKKLFNALFCILAAICLFSCTSAPKHLAKAIAKDKPYVAKETRLLWPCVVTTRDTVNTTDTVYDLIEAQCPDVEYVNPEGKTVYLPGKTIVTPGKTVTNTQYVEVKVKDEAEVFLWRNNYEVADSLHRADTSRLNKVIDSQDKKIARKNKTLLWLWGIVIAVGLLTAFKIYRKITLR